MLVDQDVPDFVLGVELAVLSPAQEGPGGLNPHPLQERQIFYKINSRGMKGLTCRDDRRFEVKGAYESRNSQNRVNYPYLCQSCPDAQF